MAKQAKSRATTLSISLPRELARQIDQRVKWGLYTSASELVREALRLLLKLEGHVEGNDVALPPPGVGSTPAARLAIAFGLAETGVALRAAKRRRADALVVAETHHAQADIAAAQQEVGPGLRLAAERLARLRIDESARAGPIGPSGPAGGSCGRRPRCSTRRGGADCGARVPSRQGHRRRVGTADSRAALVP